MAVLVALAQIVFTSTTDLVVVPVTVTDSRGRSIAGLTKDNFRVYDEGQLQAITTFQRGDAPVTVGLVVDRSASMQPKFATVVSAIEAFGRSAHESDELFVVSFNETVQRETFGGRPFTSDPSELTAPLSAILPHGTTALYDALLEGMRHLPVGQWTRKALIVVSDGEDNSSRARLADVTTTARRAGAVIYAIGLSREAADRDANDALKKLSSDSGGMAFFPPTAEVGAVLEQISRNLRDQYVLGFMSSPRADVQGARRIKVEVSSPGSRGYTVRSRASYAVAFAQ